ncbi:DUF6207 family protein [Streptomyces sp. NPDC006527]|uniref:DUF6207 family protein n=1 Tax=Streptomyces sp. NPDC006527 TaxID=3364749 RepID=UPI0036CAEA9E
MIGPETNTAQNGRQNQTCGKPGVRLRCFLDLRQTPRRVTQLRSLPRKGACTASAAWGLRGGTGGSDSITAGMPIARPTVDRLCGRGGRSTRPGVAGGAVA